MSILVMTMLAACATPKGGAGKGAVGDDPLGQLIGRETGAGDSAAARALPLGPAPTTFVGAPVGRLDRVLGAPGLIRKEGQNEFRRYDLEGCRVYAVVAPAGGTVRTVSTGPLVSGQAAPDFRVCTAGR